MIWKGTKEGEIIAFSTLGLVIFVTFIFSKSTRSTTEENNTINEHVYHHKSEINKAEADIANKSSYTKKIFSVKTRSDGTQKVSYKQDSITANGVRRRTSKHRRKSKKIKKSKK